MDQLSLADKSEDGNRLILRGGYWFAKGDAFVLPYASESHLDLHLVCARGMPVADMMAHSHPVPIIIDYPNDGYPVTYGRKDSDTKMCNDGPHPPSDASHKVGRIS